MNGSVTVTTGARLHFGLIVAAAPHGPEYSGVGVMIDEPGFTLTMSRARGQQDQIVAPEAASQRVVEFLAICRSAGRPADPVRVDVSRIIPSHVGLGSGTQLGLAVATAFAGLFQLDESTLCLGRGRRSIIGTVGFRRGGMIAHGLRSTANAGSGTILRESVPAAWRFVLITPPGAGMSGTAEAAAFAAMPPMTAGSVEQLHALVRDSWWPALQLADFHGFSAALHEFGRRVGEYFAPCQGGVFAHPQMAALAKRLHDHGYHGVAQTSWGPTIAVVCRTEEDARNLARSLTVDSQWADCTVCISAALNEGAIIQRS